jgi:hypothetical protein
VTPVGRPVPVKFTMVAGPAVRHARTVVVVLPPCVTVLDEGSAEMAKSNAGVGMALVWKYSMLEKTLCPAALRTIICQ